MKNLPLYKKLKQILLEGNYTIEDVENLGFNRAAELLGTRSFGLGLLNNMKRGLIDTLQSRDDENDMQQLKQTAKNWLDANFPNAEAERGRESGKPFVKIWLKGKPENAGHDIL